MNKKEFVEIVSRRLGISKKVCHDILCEEKKLLIEVCSKGGKICLRGFGSFVPLERKSKKCLNPQTKRYYFSRTKRYIKFKSCDGLL